MPPKKTDKNKIQEPVRTPQSFDVSRDPLPAVVPPCIPTTEDLDGYAPRVSDALFPEWAVEGLEDEDWHSVDDLFVDHDFGTEALPAWVRVETAGWAAESVTLHTFDIDTSAATSHPLLRSQQMRIPRGGSGIVITAILCASRSQPVGIGDWSLLALSNMIDQSDGPSLEMKEVDAIQYCFGSSYEPNKNLRLFRLTQ